MRAVARVVIVPCLLAWILPGLGAMGHVALEHRGACDDPFCACPVPEDGSRCSCSCCSPPEHRSSATPQLCGECSAGDVAAGVVPVPQCVPEPAQRLAAPEGSSDVFPPGGHRVKLAPSSLPEPVPRARA